MAESARPQPKKGKSNDLWYLHCPILGLASDEEGVIVVTGGGGQVASKEVPNIIEAYRWENGALRTFATVDTGKELCTGVIYIPELKWWVCNVVASVRSFTLEDDEFKPKVNFVTETEKIKGQDPWLNVTHMIDYNMVTGGTDGIIRRWTICADNSATTNASYEADAGEVKDLQFSASMEFLASCHEDKTIRVWDLASGSARHSIAWTPHNPCRARWIDDQLLILASGVRGPAKLRLYDVKGELAIKAEVLLDKMPASSMCVTQTGDVALIGLTSGVKMVLSLPNLKVVKKTGELHDMPISAACFLHPNVPVSGSGDYVIHRGPTVNAGGGGHKYILLLFFGLFIGLLYNLMIKIGSSVDSVSTLP
eukprot:GEMP01020344.1.p1 GENE.GEMP01020344.1~~GEMP01020344.1.p1  ORF type:complete len:366 (+),score=60.40 GEMP01020344.1:52-1149(+)